jgi:hypothetical protein
MGPHSYRFESLLISNNSLYTQAWDASKATNKGQYRGNDHYTISQSTIALNATSNGDVSCPSDVPYLKMGRISAPPTFPTPHQLRPLPLLLHLQLSSSAPSRQVKSPALCIAPVSVHKASRPPLRSLLLAAWLYSNVLFKHPHRS